MSGVTDPYQPIERKLRITRSCLEVLAEFRNPVAIITKNRLVTRDVDLLQELAKFDAVLISTPHSAFKDQALYRGAKLIIDTRNVVEVRTGGPVVVRA